MWMNEQMSCQILWAVNFAFKLAVRRESYSEPPDVFLVGGEGYILLDENVERIVSHRVTDLEVEGTAGEARFIITAFLKVRCL